jgi:NADH-quinone oxidoreductase subunit C
MQDQLNIPPQELFNILKTKFGDAVIEAKLDVQQPWILLAPQSLKDVCFFLRDEIALQFDYLSCLSGMDYNNGTFGVVYHLTSMAHKHKIVLKTICPKENPHVRSVSAVWGTANWHEREAFDLFGIVFDEHPDLRRILLPEDWEGHPLRKDYQVHEFYHGMKIPY